MTIAITLPDCFGMIGVILMTVAYFLLATRRMSSDSVGYSGLNIIGSCMVIYSLFYNWNISAFFMEGFWLLISLYGMYKVLK